ncbi:hypothetical protein GCM10010361_18330 [Streptomyces olivaceiscleroticus]|uniref:XRE family transcriptional regulator n=1 Tax=Streptomyces olivaceiscleroticus TaxID=68245 RepID=A0ABP3JKZ9_9ACTN
MPRALLMPTEAELPSGPHRRFLEELHLYFREAGRPEIPRILSAAEAAIEDPESRVSLKISRETVRRILKGKTLSTWKRVETLFDVLCYMSGRDPEKDRWAETEDPVQSHRSYVRELWTVAADGVEISGHVPLPAQRNSSHAAQSSAQWHESPNGGYPEEPPF